MPEAEKAPLIDRFIAWASPRRGLQRARARMQLTGVRRYEAAAFGRRTDSWIAQGTSANTELADSLLHLRNRHRDLVRNNPWAARAVQAIVSNTVGHGITAKIAADQKRARTQVAALWKAWAETTDCDAAGQNDIYGLQALVQRTVAESGECIIRRRWRRPGDGLSVPVQLQVIEPDYLDQSRTYALDGGGRIIQGVEFDSIGRRVAYWLFLDHPGDLIARQSQSVRVLATEVAHVYRIDRPGQVRGVPWGASCMLTLRDLDDYEDAYLFRQKLANCYVGFVGDMQGVDVPTTAANLGESLEPGRLEILPNGKTVTLSDPPQAGDYGPYTRDVLLRVAAAYGVTFQALTGDLSTVNFSSGRMGWLEMGRNMDGWRWHMLIPQFCDAAAGWFLEGVALSEGVRTDGVSFEWTPPRREMLDPSSEVPAMIKAIRAGITSLPEFHRQQGMDSATVFAEMKSTNDTIDQLELVLDSDPRKVSAAGLMQTTVQSAPPQTEAP